MALYHFRQAAPMAEDEELFPLGLLRARAFLEIPQESPLPPGDTRLLLTTTEQPGIFNLHDELMDESYPARFDEQPDRPCLARQVLASEVSWRRLLRTRMGAAIMCLSDPCAL